LPFVRELDGVVRQVEEHLVAAGLNDHDLVVADDLLLDGRLAR
jgi:hypothetical protein